MSTQNVTSTNTHKLSGKVAIVTGASKGIGASIAKHLAAAGAAVVVNYSSSKEGADKVVADIAAAGGKAIAVQANVANKTESERLFAESKEAFGQLDILVNNANATKSAVDGLTRTFAKELGQRKIRVNSINPGPIETEGTHSTGFIDRFQTLIPTIPLGRIGKPQDIASGVVFLASSDSEWMTGETLYVTGGLR